MPGFHTESHNNAPNRLCNAISCHFPISPHTGQKPCHRAKMRLAYRLVLPTLILIKSHHKSISASDFCQSDNAVGLLCSYMAQRELHQLRLPHQSHHHGCSSSPTWRSSSASLSPVSRQSFTISIYAKIPKPVLPKNFQTTPIRKIFKPVPYMRKILKPNLLIIYGTFNKFFILFLRKTIALHTVL